MVDGDGIVGEGMVLSDLMKRDLCAQFPRGHIVHWNYISISKHNTWWMVMVLSEKGWY